MMVRDRSQKNIKGRWLYFRAYIPDNVHQRDCVKVERIAGEKLMDSHFKGHGLHDEFWRMI